MMIKRLGCVVLAAAVCGRLAYGQGCTQDNPGSCETQVAEFVKYEQPELTSRRIFGIIPNYRSSLASTDYTPLTARQKFNIAVQDSFDPGAVALGAFFGGIGQLTKSNPSFGNGVPGYARSFAASYSDFVIGNYMSEAVYPSLFHQDPRYFRRATGNGWSRLGSAVGQIFWTHTDSGRMRFNFSEIAGNATSVAISNAYYPDNRNPSDAAAKFGMQIGVDVAANVLKEFSPELTRLLSRKHHEADWRK